MLDEHRDVVLVLDDKPPFGSVMVIAPSSGPPFASGKGIHVKV
jgi:hypothetical protein